MAGKDTVETEGLVSQLRGRTPYNIGPDGRISGNFSVVEPLSNLEAKALLAGITSENLTLEEADMIVTRQRRARYEYHEAVEILLRRHMPITDKQLDEVIDDDAIDEFCSDYYQAQDKRE